MENKHLLLFYNLKFIVPCTAWHAGWMSFIAWQPLIRVQVFFAVAIVGRAFSEVFESGWLDICYQ